MSLITLAKSLKAKTTAEIATFVDNNKCADIAGRYNFNGYKRFYHIHIRKTGGTSLNKMFLALSGENTDTFYGQLSRKANHNIISNGLIFVGWNVRLINRGNYFYAFSHTPLHQLSLPPETFTMTCFRDPVKRVLSHYNMLMDFLENRIDHPCMKTEGKWLGNSLDDFLDNIPRQHLLNQLYMFSETFDIDEAVSRVKGLSHYFFTEDFNRGIDRLNHKSGLSLSPIHTRKSQSGRTFEQHSLDRLRGMLEDEYAFLDALRD